MKKRWIVTTALCFICLLAQAQKIEWNFNEGAEEWKAVNYTESTFTEGHWNLTTPMAKEGTPYAYALIMFRSNLKPSDYGKITISLKNGTSETTARFYFKGSAGTWAYQEFAISAADQKYQSYTIDLSKDESWANGVSINTIRFDIPCASRKNGGIPPESQNKPIGIDFIKLIPVK